MLLSMTVMCQTFDNASYSFQQQHIQTMFEYLVGNFVYFTVLDYTEHSHTTVGNETLPLTVDNAEFSCKFFRNY